MSPEDEKRLTFFKDGLLSLGMFLSLEEVCPEKTWMLRQVFKNGAVRNFAIVTYHSNASVDRRFRFRPLREINKKRRSQRQQTGSKESSTSVGRKFPKSVGDFLEC